MWKKHSLAQPRCEAPKTLIPSCSVKTGLTGRISCRCNSNARIEIGTRRDCQSFPPPPANCPSSSRSAPSHSRFWRKAEFHLRLVMGSRLVGSFASDCACVTVKTENYLPADLQADDRNESMR